MGTTREFIREHKGRGKGWAKVVSYIKKGDPATLKEIAGLKKLDEFDLSDLKYAWPPPDQMTDEDRRAIHVLVAAGQLEGVGERLRNALWDEEPGQDLFGPVAAEVERVGYTTRELLAYQGAWK